MLASDLADSPLASCPARMPQESLRESLLEPFVTYRGPLPASLAELGRMAGRLLDAGIAAVEEAGNELPGGGAASADMVALAIELLKVIEGHEDSQSSLRAVCYLRLIGKEKRSFKAIGEEYGVVRATVQAIYRGIQRQFPALRSRGDKSDGARAACRRRRLGFRKKREPWEAASLWKRPLSLISPLVA